MAVKRVVDTKFWADETVIDHYSVEDKYFMLYLLTNPRTTQLGIYKLPKKIISFETGYTKEVVEVLIQRFRDNYKNILYNKETQEIAVLNSLKYSIVKGGAPVSSLLEKELREIEEDQLILDTYNHMLKWWESSSRNFDQTVKQLFEKELKQRKVPKEINDNVNGNGNDDSYPESYPESYPDSSKNRDNKKNKPSKHQYGDNKNVLLKDDEFKKLKDKFPNDYKEKINNLSYYIASTGKKYKSHYMTILNWARKDQKQSKPQTQEEDVGYGGLEF